MGEAKRKALSITGGKPAGFADVEIANPWGRAMPKAAPPRFLKPTHQVFVTERDTGALTPISPLAPYSFCEPLVDAALHAIRIGARKNWQDPHIVRVHDLTLKTS
jgi:hypothetical protein